jgi:isoleucyl-tRNA synthetase
VIGSSNDAAITLFPDEEFYQILMQFEIPELEALFIVSGVEIAEPEADAPKNSWEGLEGRIKVLVHEPKGAKCERCWRYSAFVGTSKQHPDLCQRCHQVVEAIVR